MKTRVLTGTCYVFLLLAGILIGGWAMFILIGTAMFIGTHEMYKAIRNTGIEPVRWAGYLFCVMMIFAQGISFFVPTELNLTMIAFVVSVMAAMIRLVSHGKIAVDSMIATVFPMIYPGIFFTVLMNMTALENRAFFAAAMVLSFFAASICDAFALFGGMMFGKHKLAPVLSPKKTIEGSVSGLIFAGLFGLAMPTIMKFVFSWDQKYIMDCAQLPPAWVFALLGLACGILSQVGDLAASMVKRHCQIKDYGSLLPGHGGIMDRLDGTLFCAGACYIFFEILRLFKK